MRMYCFQFCKLSFSFCLGCQLTVFSLGKKRAAISSSKLGSILEGDKEDTLARLLARFDLIS
jgi:hypothetical protein